jgi:mono/diheme cytochrome c family protein
MRIHGEVANMTESFGKRSAIRLMIIVSAILAASLPALTQQQIVPTTSSNSVHAVLAAGAATSSAAKSDAAAAQAAFNRAWTVFVSPRCQNCHPSGDAPLQGDDSHVHIQDVKRGAAGIGVYGMKCNTCHQAANLPGANMPPGNPKWSLPPANMKMVIQGETAGEFCRQLKDPAKNGHRTLAQIIEHVSTDDLVGWGWNPGDGRTLPPLDRPEFVAAMKAWVDNGAACPQ